MDIAAKALLIAQSSLDVTANNLANVDTKGYSRQELQLIPSPSYDSPYGPMGTGVSAENITRFYDQYLIKNLIEQSSLLSRYETEQSALWQIETIFNESNEDGLNSMLNEFWNSWQEVANNPEGIAERVSLIENSQALIDTISIMRASLDVQVADINRQIEDAVTKVNILVRELAGLNEAITSTEVGNTNANELRDQRDLKLRELAELIEIDQFENPDGNVTVLTPKGFPLVEENIYWTLSTGRDAYENVQVYWNRTPDAQMDITDTFDEGTLGGLVEVRSTIKDFSDQFDEFTGMLIKEVNRQYSQGTGLEYLTDTIGTYEVSPFARLETDFYGENNDIVFTAKNEGAPGDQVTITFADLGGINQPFSLTVTGNDITINLASDSAGDIITTAQEAVDFINSDNSAEAQAARDLVSVTLAEENYGQGVLSVMDTTNLNRQLSNLLYFGEDLTAGSFDLVTYDAAGTATVNTVNVNPDDTREDIIAQIGETFSDGIEGVRASIYTDGMGKSHLRIEAEASGGYGYAFSNDSSSVLMALGINTFFTGYDTTNIQLNEYIKDNLSLINAGIVEADAQTSQGNNVNALDMADLKDQTFFFQNGMSTISEAYNALVADIGSTTSITYRNVNYTESLVLQLEQQRDSVSAVSTDEELMHMIKFQYAYMAAAQLISTSDEMLQTLISMV